MQIAATDGQLATSVRDETGRYAHCRRDMRQDMKL